MSGARFRFVASADRRTPHPLGWPCDFWLDGDGLFAVFLPDGRPEPEVVHPPRTEAWNARRERNESMRNDYWCEGLPKGEIAEKYGVSRQRVDQIVGAVD